MVGYPKTLSTKEDYLYVKDNFPYTFWKKDFQSLLDTVNEWYNLGEIEKDKGVTDNTHKVVEDTENNKYYQYELKENKDCKLNRLGFTADEVNTILNSIKE